MNTFKNRDRIIARLNAEAGNSFTRVYAAMCEASLRRQSAVIDEDEVVAIIREGNGG